MLVRACADPVDHQLGFGRAQQAQPGSTQDGCHRALKGFRHPRDRPGNGRLIEMRRHGVPLRSKAVRPGSRALSWNGTRFSGQRSIIAPPVSHSRCRGLLGVG
jgi:hypothetical protein